MFAESASSALEICMMKTTLDILFRGDLCAEIPLVSSRRCFNTKREPARIKFPFFWPDNVVLDINPFVRADKTELEIRRTRKTFWPCSVH